VQFFKFAHFFILKIDDFLTIPQANLREYDFFMSFHGLTNQIRNWHAP